MTLLFIQVIKGNYTLLHCRPIKSTTMNHMLYETECVRFVLNYTLIFIHQLHLNHRKNYDSAL